MKYNLDERYNFELFLVIANNNYYIKKKLCFRNLKEQLFEKHLFKKQLSNAQL